MYLCRILWFSVFSPKLARELVERHRHIVFDNHIALCLVSAPAQSSWAHVRRTLSFIISLAVRQTLHMRIKLGLVFSLSIFAVVRIGSGTRERWKVVGAKVE